MAGIVSATAACIVTLFCMQLSVEGCVPLDPGCQPPSTTPAITFFGDINSPVVIIAIVVGCVAAVVIIVLLLWLCCWCWYRNTENTDEIPSIIRRTVIVKQKQQVKKVAVQRRPVKKIEVQVKPPPPPVIQHLPSEKIVVVQPAVTKPTSMLLTVSDGQNTTDNGPMLTTCVEQPLKFTLTPEYVGQRAVTNLSVYEHVNDGQSACH